RGLPLGSTACCVGQKAWESPQKVLEQRMETGANPGSLGLAMRQSPPMKNIVILISGGGSNMAAIVRASQQQNWAKQYNARVAAVVSNKADAKGLAFARDNGI